LISCRAGCKVILRTVSISNPLFIRQKIKEWCIAAEAVSAFKYKTLGYLGHTYEGMYDMHTDPTSFTRTFKSHVKMLEMCELIEYVDSACEVKIKEKIDIDAVKSIIKALVSKSI
jgi:L-arabinose isomerase